MQTLQRLWSFLTCTLIVGSTYLACYSCGVIREHRLKRVRPFARQNEKPKR